jgi:hypothetical protein
MWLWGTGRVGVKDFLLQVASGSREKSEEQPWYKPAGLVHRCPTWRRHGVRPARFLPCLWVLLAGKGQHLLYCRREMDFQGLRAAPQNLHTQILGKQTRLWPTWMFLAKWNVSSKEDNFVSHSWHLWLPHNQKNEFKYLMVSDAENLLLHNDWDILP